MMTKVVVSVSIEIAHPDGTKLRKRDVREHVKRVLEESGEYPSLVRAGAILNKAVVRAVDID